MSAGRLRIAACVIAACLLCASAAVAIAPGQVHDFQDGAQGWQSGGANPNPPTWIAEGGPRGAGDAYLRIDGNGLDGPGGNLVAWNSAQWSGDYTAAGVVAIRADLRNLGPSDLVIRLLLESRVGGITTSAAAILPAGGTWRSALLPLEGVGADADAVLAEVTKLRILHAPTPAGTEPVAGALGVDNVTALSGNACVDAGLVRRDGVLCRVYCDVLDCPSHPARPRCRHLSRRIEWRTGSPPPCELDADADGVEDALDNCPSDPNPDQGDLDADGVGDACDNCPSDPNPGQEDGFGEPGVGDACDCPCFAAAEAASLVETLGDANTYEGLACVDTRVLAKPLTFVSATRRDGQACAASTPECSALAVEFTEDRVCQFHPPAPDAGRVVQGIGDAQREACREGIVAAAEAGGLRCN